jgi:hypothetical protein
MKEAPVHLSCAGASITRLETFPKEKPPGIYAERLFYLSVGLCRFPEVVVQRL